nr:hypothetical protein [Tanacetum cinerariifolium]
MFMVTPLRIHKEAEKQAHTLLVVFRLLRLPHKLTVVAEQLFQSSEHAADDLLWFAHSLYPSAEEKVAGRVSAVIVRKLFLPGIFNHSVLGATFQDFNELPTDSGFHSLTDDRLRKEVISRIKHHV